MSSILTTFHLGMAELRIGDVRDKEGRTPHEIKFVHSWDKESYVLIRWEKDALRVAYTLNEAELELRLIEQTSVKVILVDDFQTNGAFVHPQIWTGQASSRDRSEVVDIPVLPRKQS